MQIFFRVDSSYRIGLGHIMRCLVLANALRAHGHQAVFICRDLPGNFMSELKRQHFSVISLAYEEQPEQFVHLSEHQQWLATTKEEDLQQTVAHLAKNPPIDWLVIDHYSLDAAWESACRSHVKNIMVIDDLADREHDCDMLVDQNYYVSTENLYRNKIPVSALSLIGPQYALLRPEFYHQRQFLSPRAGEVKRLLVTLGSDAKNITRMVLEGISHSVCRDFPVDIVLSAESQHKKEIQVYCESRPNYTLHCPAENMAILMQQADLAIGAGGTTTWERCCLGLPSLVLHIANNQSELIKQGLQANIFAYAGNINEINKIDIANQLNMMISDKKMLQNMSQAAMRLVDGLGVRRVLKQMFTLE